MVGRIIAFLLTMLVAVFLAFMNPSITISGKVAIGGLLAFAGVLLVLSHQRRLPKRPFPNWGKPPDMERIIDYAGCSRTKMRRIRLHTRLVRRHFAATGR